MHAPSAATRGEHGVTNIGDPPAANSFGTSRWGPWDRSFVPPDWTIRTLIPFRPCSFRIPHKRIQIFALCFAV